MPYPTSLNLQTRCAINSHAEELLQFVSTLRNRLETDHPYWRQQYVWTVLRISWKRKWYEGQTYSVQCSPHNTSFPLTTKSGLGLEMFPKLPQKCPLTMKSPIHNKYNDKISKREYLMCPYLLNKPLNLNLYNSSYPFHLQWRHLSLTCFIIVHLQEDLGCSFWDVS